MRKECFNCKSTSLPFKNRAVIGLEIQPEILTVGAVFCVSLLPGPVIAVLREAFANCLALNAISLDPRKLILTKSYIYDSLLNGS